MFILFDTNEMFPYIIVFHCTRILYSFVLNRLADNLPAATKIELPDKEEEPQYAHGYKLGFVMDKNVSNITF